MEEKKKKGEKQHFIPKAYLKNFCLPQTPLELYHSRSIQSQNKWTQVKVKNINSICYYHDLYNVSTNYSIKNKIIPDYVERNAFWYEKGFINDLIKKIQHKDINNDSPCIKKIPLFYLSMVSRNPQFKDRFDENKIEMLLEHHLGKFREKSTIIKKEIAFTFDTENLIKSIRSNILTEYSKQNMFSSSIYQLHKGSSGTFNSIISKLQGYKLMIGEIKDNDQFFITSDAPSFTLCELGKIHSWKFKDDAYHYIPISSKIILILIHPIIGFNNPNLCITNVNKEEVHYINQSIMKTSSHYVFCENKEFLQTLISKL